MKLFDLRHPFFNPLWRRVVTVAFCMVWALFELAGNNVFWAVLFGGLGLVAAWVFFADWTHITEETDE